MDLEYGRTMVTIVAGALGAAAAYLLGGWDVRLQGLIILAIIDYLTGVVAAARNEGIDSDVGWWGLMKKVGIFVAIAAGHAGDQIFDLQGPLLRTSLIFGFGANELWSIGENLGRWGVRLPARVRAAFARLREGE